MKLLHLKTDYFRQHQDTYINFPTGVIGLLGSNGSGKTTIIEAISFAFFGTKALRGKVDSVTTRNAAKGKKAKVELLFSHGEDEYRIERSLIEAEIFRGGESTPLCIGTREVTEFVSTLLGMEFDEFHSTYLTEQKGLEFLSGKKGAAERERFIVRILGYDRLEEVQALLRAERSELKAKISAWEASIGSKDSLIEEKKELVSKIKVLKKSLEDSESELKREDKKLTINKTYYEEIVQSEKKYRALNNKLNTDSIKVEEWKKRTKDFEESLKKIQVEISTYTGNRTKEDLRTKIQSLEEVILSKEEKLKNKKEDRETKVKDISARIISMENRQEELKLILANNTKLDGDKICPTCGQEIVNINHLKDDINRKSVIISDEIKDLTKKKIHSQKETEEESELKNELNELIQQQKFLQEEIEKIVRSESLGKIEEEYKQKIVQNEESIKIIDSEIINIKNEIEKLSFSESDFARIKAIYETSSSLINILRLSRTKTEGELETKEALLKRVEQSIIDLDSKEAELLEFKKEFSKLDESDRTLSEFRKSVNSEIRPRLAEIASEYITELTDGRYVAVDLSEDFSPSVVDDGERKPVISGGEEDILNLCLRLALSQMLAEKAGHDFSLLMLDEIFGSLDDDRRQYVLELLERLKSRFDQIIVISHFEDVKDGLEHALYISYDEIEGCSKVEVDFENLEHLNVANI